jgi:hypothetical protein
VLVALAAWPRSLHELACREYIYPAGARNIAERGSLDTQYYSGNSLWSASVLIATFTCPLHPGAAPLVSFRHHASGPPRR